MNLDRYSNRVSVFTRTTITLIAATALATFSAMPIVAQEDAIEIVNQDGERVEGARLMVKPETAELENPEAANDGAKKNLLKSEGGKLTFVDDDGNEQQIDLANARSVVVQQSTQSVNNNGQQQTKVVSKAIVVDADGQRHEINLGENGGEGLDLPGMPKGFSNMFGAKRDLNKYMIGAHCAKVTPALQAQLSLAENSGLLVNTIGQGSPAETAGLQKHDILLFADDQELLTQEDLVRVVQKAGEAGSALSLTVMRAGKEIGVDVSPVERTAGQMRVGWPRGMNELEFDFGPLEMGFGDGEFKRFGGGALDDRLDNMRQQMEQVQQQMQEMQQRMRAQFEAGE